MRLSLANSIVGAIVDAITNSIVDAIVDAIANSIVSAIVGDHRMRLSVNQRS